VRHAEAGRVEVRLAFEPQRIVLVVVDDGRGFQPAEVGEGHYGVRNMRERAQKLGGQLEIHSRPGEGTRVVVKLPLAGGGQDPASAF
jgi:two-component system sensor histidine kinase DegS